MKKYYRSSSYCKLKHAKQIARYFNKYNHEYNTVFKDEYGKYYVDNRYSPNVDRTTIPKIA